jgi:hypothetical protein
MSFRSSPPEDGNRISLRNFVAFGSFLQSLQLIIEMVIVNVIIRMETKTMRWTEHIARVGEKRNACRILMGKPEGKIPLGKPRCK